MIILINVYNLIVHQILDCFRGVGGFFFLLRTCQSEFSSGSSQSAHWWPKIACFDNYISSQWWIFFLLICTPWRQVFILYLVLTKSAQEKVVIIFSPLSMFVRKEVRTLELCWRKFARFFGIFFQLRKTTFDWWLVSWSMIRRSSGSISWPSAARCLLHFKKMFFKGNER